MPVVVIDDAPLSMLPKPDVMLPPVLNVLLVSVSAEISDTSVESAPIGNNILFVIPEL